MTSKGQVPLEAGRWHADLALNDSTNLPFILIVSRNGISIENADEIIPLTDLRVIEDSITCRFPLYDAELKLLSLGSLTVGEFINHGKTSNNVFYLRATKEPSFRFSSNPSKPSSDLSGKWKLVFDGEEGVNKQNVAVLKQTGNRVTGSVLTPTGDHRFLDGEISGTRLRLSTFNGAFAFLYEGVLQTDGSLNGRFYSGHTGYDTWTAFKDPAAELPDANSLVFIKPGAGRFDFSFPDINGRRWTMNEPELINKVRIVQIMGTWCPNCLDESNFLNDYFSRNRARGVEIVALDFERTNDSTKVWNNIKRVKDRLGLTYPILFGGNSNRDSSGAALPMLSKVFAYPTTIIVDKKGEVRKIHTGFSGPATGEEFVKYKNEFEGFLEALLNE
ncbi:MAG: peroxiredoxin family protein [Bacteroidota bacterium]